MGKKAWNTFVKEHQTGICVQTIIDWFDPKGQTSPKGLIYPSAYGMLTEALGLLLQGDWTTTSIRIKKNSSTAKKPKFKGAKAPKSPPVIAVKIIIKAESDLQILKKHLVIHQVQEAKIEAPCASAFQMEYSQTDYGSFAKLLSYV